MITSSNNASKNKYPHGIISMLIWLSSDAGGVTCVIQFWIFCNCTHSSLGAQLFCKQHIAITPRNFGACILPIMTKCVHIPRYPGFYCLSGFTCLLGSTGLVGFTGFLALTSFLGFTSFLGSTGLVGEFLALNGFLGLDLHALLQIKTAFCT